MRLGVMQPYFFPYIGYFQLISAVDHFVIYDNIKYSKKGWVNRNRLLRNGKDMTFSICLKGGSDFLDICERELAVEFDRERLLNQIRNFYIRAPHFEQTYPLIEQVVRYPEENLFLFLKHSIVRVCAHLGITTNITVSSSINIDHQLIAQDKIVALCRALGATTYLNAIGGIELYSKQAFSDNGIELKFIKALPFEYLQFGEPFVPWLSIIDVMMFNPLSAVQEKIRHGYVTC